jgi:S-adenosylmethionine:tRNA ribosyltransferase-isomerase
LQDFEGNVVNPRARRKLKGEMDLLRLALGLDYGDIRLLWGRAPELEDHGIADLPNLLRAGDCLVVNDSKVIAARLVGRRIGRGDTEPAIEATLHKRLDGSHWRAFVKPAKKLQVGDTLRLGTE